MDERRNMSVTNLLSELIATHSTDGEQEWLGGKTTGNTPGILAAFVATPRFIARRPVQPDEAIRARLAVLVPGWNLDGWTLDRLVRVFLLLHLDAATETAYAQRIETLFDTAELQELTALYSALPVLAYPEHWVFRATEAVRSNMGPVFDAIAFGNPYASAHFSEAPWNQLVLKCIFNDKPIHRIAGLDRRANQALADHVSDFAHERWAAGRQVPPSVWRLVGRFMNEALFDDLNTLANSLVLQNQQAALLVAAETNYAPARHWLDAHPDWQQALADGTLRWETLDSNPS